MCYQLSGLIAGAFLFQTGENRLGKEDWIWSRLTASGWRATITIMLKRPGHDQVNG